MTCVMGICAVGALLNIALIKRRGTSAILLAVAFIALGFTVQLYRSGFALPVVYGGGVAVVAILILDFVLRAGKPRSGR